MPVDAYPISNGTWPKPGKVDATSIADKFNKEISDTVASYVKSGRGRPCLVGLLANNDPRGDVYARMGLNQPTPQSAKSWRVRRTPQTRDFEQHRGSLPPAWKA